MKPILLAAAVALGATSAQSAVLDYRFTAVFSDVTQVVGITSVVDTAAALSTITGRVLLDPTPDPVASNPLANAFGPATIQLDQLTLGQNGALVLPQSPFFVSDDNPILNADTLAIGVAGGTFAPFPSDGLVESVGLSFVDTTSAALSSTAFPDLIELQDFTSATLFVRGTDRVGGVTNGQETARFTITELAPVPLPAGLPLMLAGLAGLALVRRRQG